MVDWVSRVNLSSANATPPNPPTYLRFLWNSALIFQQGQKPIYRAISEVCCKRWPNPSEAEMGPLSILKDFSLPCRFSHPSLHLAGISCRQQAEGRHIPPACWNMKSWISVGRNKSYSHFPPILEVNAQNKMCFVMSLRLIRLLNFSWYW